MKIYKNKYNIEENNSILIIDEKQMLIMKFLLNEEDQYSIRFIDLSYNLKAKLKTEYQEIELFEFLICIENIKKGDLISKLIARIIRSSLHKKMNKMDNLIDFFKEYIGTNNDLEEVLYKKREFQDYLFELKEKYKENL
jgi:hypothetical protein